MKKKNKIIVINFGSSNYTEYKSNGDKNKILSVEECLNKIRPYLKGCINNLKNLVLWKIKINNNSYFFSSDDNDRVQQLP